MYFALQVLEAVSLIDIRRRFIEALAPLFGRPLEADPVCILGINLSIYKALEPLTLIVSLSFLSLADLLQKSHIS